MFTLKRELETFFIIVLATGMSLFFLVQRNNMTKQPIISPSLPAISAAAPVGSSLPEVIITDSPDGNKTLTTKKQKMKDSVIYSFFVSDTNSTNQKLIFEKTENLSQSLIIPFNTWSPDNVYFFLKEEMKSINNYYVFYSSGKTFSNNNQYINIQELFTKKFSRYTIENVTGWATPNLLIINTRTENGDKGPSFWFDLPSQSFIQLATHFN